MSDLTQNERLVLPLFADGKKPSNREIADRFGWSMGKVAGVCHRMQLKNLIEPRRRRDIQFIKPKVKGPTCQFIEGEPRDRNFCGAPATNGPYCKSHYERCYDIKRTQSANWLTQTQRRV